MKIHHKKFIAISFMLFAVFSTTAFASEDQVIVNQSVTGADVSAPVVPANVSATAISTSQIDLSWDASSDNVGTTGYQVFRGLNQIATSTLTTYSDTGLSESTTYSYTITAFDASGNTSARSATTSATTLTTSTVTTTNVGGGGPIERTPAEILFSNIGITAEENQVRISWDTIPETLSTVTWGETNDYIGGVLTEVIYKENHAVKIVGLESGKTYYFRIEALEPFGAEGVFTGSFKTATPPDNTPPSNISNLQIGQNGEKLDLSWNNPNNEDFEEVRVVRSDIFYPQDPLDGRVIYEGAGEFATDENVGIGKIYYYTVFARDVSLNYSSGVIGVGELRALIVDGVEVELPIAPTDPFESFPEAEETDVKIKELSILDFDFLQNGESSSFAGGGTIKIDAEKDLIVSLDYDKVPEVLKTISVTLKDPLDPKKTFSFLLRVNEDKTAFNATISPLLGSGEYEMDIVVLNHSNQKIKRLNGALVAEGITEQIEERFGFAKIFGIKIWWWILVLVMIWLGWRKYKTRNKKQLKKDEKLWQQ